jgi:hypothetical protein
VSQRVVIAYGRLGRAEAFLLLAAAIHSPKGVGNSSVTLLDDSSRRDDVL